MKYIHKQLGREANYFQTEYVEGYKISCNGLLVFGDNWITADKLLALGFEPVKEEVPDWIQFAYEYYQTPMPARDKNSDVRYQMKFREAIEKYILKEEQQKITTTDLLNLGYLELGGISGDTKYITMNAISNLLKGKGLFI